MARIDTEIFINAPVDRCYQMWCDFESQPTYMQHVKEVRKIGDNKYHVVVEALGQKVEYDATITEQKENERISWQAETGLKNRGTVEFKPEGNGCRMHLIWEEQVGGPIAQAAEDLTGFAKGTIDEDLQRFKQVCEAQGRERLAA